MIRTVLRRADEGQRSSLDTLMATAAALAVAFAFFAMPDPLFGKLVGSTGLSSLLLSAEPPFDFKARFAVIGLAGGGAFALVFSVLRSLSGPSGRSQYRAMPSFQPRIRRVDAHPDAPAPRPIIAARDIGEPADEPDGSASEAVLVLDTPHLEASEKCLEAAPDQSICPSNAEDSERAAQWLIADGDYDIPDPPAGESISELMARLEHGLAARFSSAEESAPLPDAADSESEGSIEQRLRAAIHDLNRLAYRHG